eukprot:352238_1
MLSLLLPIFLFYICTATKITISSKLGDVTGNVIQKQTPQAKVYEFLGIQYGISPVGNLRFSPTQLNESWNSSYDATTYGPACIQNNAYESNEAEMSEDCLYLNIWTSSVDKNANLPVMVWIHGGGFITGSGSDKTYNAKNVVGLASDIVVVTLNYRLGVLGFLQNQGIHDQYGYYGGLNGLYDQIQAINWVYKYIAEFGGNPDDLTIYGESAGGISTCMLMISPIVAQQPFKIKRTIIESGSCIGGWGPGNLTLGLEFSDAALVLSGYSTTLKELRTYNATQLTYDVLNTTNNLWLPSVDKYILNDLPSNIYGKQSIKPFNVEQSVIMGTNSLDGVVSYPWNYGPYPKTNIQYKQFLNKYISNQTQVDLIYNYYYPTSQFPAYLDHTNASLAYFTVNCDVCLACTSLIQMEQMLNGNTGVDLQGYVYLFRGPSPPYYAGHASELNFVFNHNYPIENVFFEMDWNQNLSDSMVSAWSNFGKVGVPNIMNHDVNVQWTQYGDSNVMIFDDNIRTVAQYGKNYRNNVCDFWWNEVGQQTMLNICQDGAGL